MAGQKNAPVRVDGNVVKSERKFGSMPARENPNDTITWDYVDARVLNDGYDTIDVRFPSDGSIPVPPRDVRVSLRCEARVSGGDLRLTVVSVDQGTYEDLATEQLAGAAKHS